MLATAGAGKDPFQARPPARRARRDPEAAADPDLETVGALLEGARLYVLSGVYIAGRAASLVLIKVPIQPLFKYEVHRSPARFPFPDKNEFTSGCIEHT